MAGPGRVFFQHFLAIYKESTLRKGNTQQCRTSARRDTFVFSRFYHSIFCIPISFVCGICPCLRFCHDLLNTRRSIWADRWLDVISLGFGWHFVWVYIWVMMGLGMGLDMEMPGWDLLADY